MDRLRSYVLKKSLFGRLGTPVTKQRPWVWIIFNIWLIGACSSTIGSSVLTVLFIRPYPLFAGKRYFHELNLELKKIMQQLKKIEKETNFSLTLRTWSWFSIIVISVAMRFFRNATRSAFNKNELLESIRQIFSFACLVLKGRAQKDVFAAAMFEEKMF